MNRARLIRHRQERLKFNRETKTYGARRSEFPVGRLESSVFALVSSVHLQCQNRCYKEVESVWLDIFLENYETLVIGLKIKLSQQASVAVFSAGITLTSA